VIGYHASDAICAGSAGEPRDVDISVQVREVRMPRDSNGYAVVFRLVEPGKFYALRLAHGQWALYKYFPTPWYPPDEVDNLGLFRLTGWTSNSAIHHGADATNAIIVRMRDAHFEFYANGWKLGEVDDNLDAPYLTGGIGLIGGYGVDAAFTDLRMAQSA